MSWIETITGPEAGTTAGLTIYRGNSLDNLVDDWKAVFQQAFVFG